MEFFANRTGFELANSHYPGAIGAIGAIIDSQAVREVRCYPPVSQPPSIDLTPLAQIAQHAERLFAEILSLGGEAPPVSARVICGDEKLAILRLRVGPCSPVQAYRAMSLVEPLNEGTPSTHLLQGRVSGAWRIDKVDIDNNFIQPTANSAAQRRSYFLHGPHRNAG